MSRTGAIFFVAIAAATSFAISACSSGDVAVGSTQQDLKKTPNGGATGNGQTCSWDDTVGHDVATGTTTTTPAPNGPYKVGDKFKAQNGCDDCTCTTGGITCLALPCAPPPGGGGTCAYNGKTYAAGESFKSSDGCNNCGCQSDGSIACTELACAPAPISCKKTGCSGEICSDQDVASSCIWTASYACYQTATCEVQSDGKCGFTQTADLTSCLATKK